MKSSKTMKVNCVVCGKRLTGLRFAGSFVFSINKCGKCDTEKKYIGDEK